MKTILLIEDNDSISKGLKYSLEQENFEVSIAQNVSKSKEILENNNFDLIVLDITLPDGNGLELCKYIKENYETPIIFLTAKDEETDVVKGFDLGAEDYIIKPFRTRELISRINNVLRRNKKEINNELKAGNVVIDVEANRIYVNGEEIIFTALEYKILVLLFSNLNKTVTRDKILDKIWDIAGNFVNDNTLTVYIKRIRAKLGQNDVIKTIKGIGYRVDE